MFIVLFILPIAFETPFMASAIVAVDFIV